MRLKEIGEIIKKYRELNHMEHNDLAEAIKKTKPYISRIERGNLQTPPSEETLEKIAEVLNISIEDKDKVLFLAAEERTPEIVLKRLESLTDVLETLLSYIDVLLRTYDELKPSADQEHLKDIFKEAFIIIYNKTDDLYIKEKIKRIIYAKFN